MSNMLTHEQIEDLLVNVLNTPKINEWKGDTVQFCCTIHGESHPSCGIHADLDGMQLFNCFSCGASGTIPWLVYKTDPERFKSMANAVKFLEKRYGIDYKEKAHRNFDGDIKEYTDYFIEEVDTRHTLPRTFIAPFRSGKETYHAFLERGFSLDDVKEYMIGRDVGSETITIPVFYEDGALAGVIGRYIDPNRPHNMRYKIYDFPKGSIVYPLDKLEVENDTIIVVEGMFDCMMIRKWGYFNVVAIMGNSLSKEQANIICSKCSKVILLLDSDDGGKKGINIARKILGNRVTILTPTYYPKNGKDPSEWGELETVKVIKSAKMYRDILLI